MSSYSFMPSWLKNLYPADQRAAVEYFRKQVDAQMLEAIACSDWGEGVEKHLSALYPIWRGERFSELDHWYPMEVLELDRWSEPEDLEDQSRERIVDSHRMRAFSCATLLATTNFEPERQTLIQLLESAQYCGAEALSALARFLTWKICNWSRGDDKSFFVLGLIAIDQELNPRGSIEKEFELAEWLESEEERARENVITFSYRSQWLFGLSNNNMRDEKWKTLAADMCQRSSNGPLSILLEQMN